MHRLDELAGLSESPDYLLRRYLTKEHAATNRTVQRWMEQAGMQTRIDAAGNVIGRYEGLEPEAPALLLGSHLDTVRDAGRFDGALGVVLPISCIQALHDKGERLEHAIEVIGFGDEEGLRFHSTLLGSRAVAGTFDSALLDVVDADGISMRQAMHDFALDGDAIERAARRPTQIAAYLEVHIEQGPVLEAEGLAVGTVTSIAGATRLEATVNGMAGHAGTVPMALRRDALVAAALMVQAVETVCTADPELVGTVGRLEVQPGAVNVIPGAVIFSLDIRAGQDAQRQQAVARITSAWRDIADQRDVSVSVRTTHDNNSCHCAPWLMEQVDRAVTARGMPVRRLPSGAGHDAMAIAELCPVAMLFVRCRGGISHHPDEDMSAEDADVAARVLLHFIREFGLNKEHGR
jgi:allantoate deiminase